MWQDDFLSGHIDGQKSKISWAGNFSKPWDQLSKELYFDNSEIVIWNVRSGSWQKGGRETITEVSLLPFIKCFEIGNFYQQILAAIFGGMHMYIIDPKVQPSYRVISGMTDGLINVGSSSATLKEASYYRIKTFISKKNPDKTACKEYILPDTFASCVEENTRKKMLEILGCLPPHIADKNDDKVCTGEINFEDLEKAKEAKSILLNFVSQTRSLKNVDFESECPTQCTSMLFQAEKVMSKDIADKTHEINIVFDDVVEILEEENNYNIFDLIVEAGSSLGLWIGLSALGVIDVLKDIAFKGIRFLIKNDVKKI